MSRKKTNELCSRRQRYMPTGSPSARRSTYPHVLTCHLHRMFPTYLSVRVPARPPGLPWGICYLVCPSCCHIIPAGMSIMLSHHTWHLVQIVVWSFHLLASSFSRFSRFGRFRFLTSVNCSIYSPADIRPSRLYSDRDFVSKSSGDGTLSSGSAQGWHINR